MKSLLITALILLGLIVTVQANASWDEDPQDVVTFCVCEKEPDSGFFARFRLMLYIVDATKGTKTSHPLDGNFSSKKLCREVLLEDPACQ